MVTCNITSKNRAGLIMNCEIAKVKVIVFVESDG